MTDTASNNETVISVKNVSKSYKLYHSPIDRLKEALHPFGKKYHHDFFALKDINFSVKRGETLGIIGRNGSGKSTLLKIITGVLTPSSGSVEVKGKISALLELGAGFNPELTGLENIYFNGTLNGFTKKEIDERLDDILAFADIGEFIDQPVKVYSSGMFVRLAFAAAINIDPEILIVDEALAVGDIKFQNKCYRKFKDYQENGKTILFVSHSQDVVKRYCNKTILLDLGKIEFAGNTSEAINKYNEMQNEGSKNITFANNNKNNINGNLINCIDNDLKVVIEYFLSDTNINDMSNARKHYNVNEDRFGNGKAKIIDFLIVSNNTLEPEFVLSGSWIELYIKVLFCDDVEHPVYGFNIKNSMDMGIFGTNTELCNIVSQPVRRGQIRVVKFKIKAELAQGSYFINIATASRNCESTDIPMDRRYSFIVINVLDSRKYTGLCYLKNFIAISK